MIKCGLCQKTACEDFHLKFLVSCKFCREKQCKACKEFNIAKDVLFKSLDDTGKRICQQFYKILFKFILWISTRKLSCNNRNSSYPKEKLYDVKSYHKSNKIRAKLVIKNSITAISWITHSKDKNTHFTKKFNLV